MPTVAAMQITAAGGAGTSGGASTTVPVPAGVTAIGTVSVYGATMILGQRRRKPVVFVVS